MSEDTAADAPFDDKAPAKAGYEKVDSWFDLPAMERDILKLWEDTDAFNLLREKNRGKEKYSFLDGPITANNPMGVHHAWGRTYKDAYQRYWAMNGRELRYQNGFDCQGLWVEVEVEKEKGFTTKRQVEEYGIDRFVNDCKARVIKYSGVQTDQSKRLGMWMDWDNSYYTMSEENNYSIWAFLKKCHSEGKVYRGTDVMPWSGRSGCAYSHMEVIEGRKLVAHTSVFVRFPLIDKPGENLLIWTTTPWTLTSNVAAAVNVDLEYVRLRSKKDGQIYYVAAENVEFKRLDKQFKEKKEWLDGVPKLKTIAQIFNERGGYEIEGKIKGAGLVGLRYAGPFDELEAQSIPGGYPFENPGVTTPAKEAHRVIDGGRDSQGNPAVVAGEGTGIVHIAPGCGDVDHVIGKKEGLPLLSPLDAGALFIDKFGSFTGKNATSNDVRDLVLDSLTQKGLLIATEQYPHFYPHCWRTGDELVFRLVDEWYINMDWRERIKKIVDDIRWIPAWGHDREMEWLENMSDWMISKKRFWGLALPIWACEKCGHFDVIGGREELKSRAIEGWDKFEGHTPHRPWIDQVKIACEKCGSKAHRVPDVGNPWLDAGIVPYSTTGYSTDREYWAKWIPADLIVECFPGQFRNWFYSLLAMSAMMENMAPFKTLKGYALVRDEKGEEMHKSKGNAIWFNDAADQAGADVMRWLYMRHDPAKNLNFGFALLREIRGKFINTLWNTYGFYVNYARIAGFVPSENHTPFTERRDFDRWIITELEDVITRCRASIEDINIRGATRALEDFVETLSNWYIRHNRRRFWGELTDPDCRAAFETLFECLYGITRLAAPIIPFMTEKMYQNLLRAVVKDAPVSVHLADYPVSDPSRMDRALADEMEAVIRINSIALSAREAKKIKVRQPLSLLTVGPANPVEARAVARFEETLKESLNVKKIEIAALGAKSPMSYDLKPDFKKLGPRMGKLMNVLAQAIGVSKDELIASLKSGAETVTVNIEGGPVELTKEDLILAGVSPESLAVAEDGNTWVAFNAEITEEIRIEGYMREILRKLQVARKNEGLEIENRIMLKWDTASESLEKVFEVHGAYLAEELLAVSVERVKGLQSGAELEAGEHLLRVSIVKA
ncbi:MAG: isoleucine--tRNA ligase [Nitrospinae bacterium]|nr:isoleucine--tRNA ligase [Nitrospinota bacterium]